ncbi:uncharacterized protein L969DRAFT_44197 [Mixia osmundae IAM 14324]|uniref:uncharacterized protein n=1 Tax=Mixia osmundae (strain CBS 9802 / IAM 14324 / JCM 22182 / KY 12970) TaxID=764103 RepID=UPI0004A5494C|nr:uncharacterized protein L969DRAFT_44197 [Mixia osmundae IAM 14324]KEI42018.1 hypothetical protein L969DRAFT_44197 [Mixia osmundae IAM 14324]
MAKVNGHASDAEISALNDAKTHVARGIGRSSDLIFEKGEGSWVWTVDGHKIFDLTSGIAVSALGHAHPAVTEAIVKQASKLIHTSVNIAYTRPYLELTTKLLKVMPDKSLDTVFFWNSGSEAVEAAIKLARVATKKQNIISYQGSYHGRTWAAMALTRSKTIYSKGYHPLMPGVYTAPFPYGSQYGCPVPLSEDQLTQAALRDLKLLFDQQTAPTDTAAIIIEPVLGEGGYVPCPPAYLAALRKICDQHNILLIFDEVQTGFGRTGTYFMTEQTGVRPDILILAKGIANGLPLSAIISRKELMDMQEPGTQGGTYSGNAVACAAGIAVADVMQEPGFMKNVAARSKQFFDVLHDLKQSPKTKGIIVDVRGKGLMIGVEFDGPLYPSRDQSKPVPEGLAAKVQKKCMEKDLYILTTSIFQVIRLIPALIITGKSSAQAQMHADL